MQKLVVYQPHSREAVVVTNLPAKGLICKHPLQSLMGRLFNVYAGYEQQDAHEFLLNLIDKLHEDLNKVG